MKRVLSLMALLSLTLSACGSGGVTSSQLPSPNPSPSLTGGQTSGSSAVIAGLNVAVTAAVLDPATGKGSAFLSFSGPTAAQGLSAQALGFSVVSAPAGLSVQPAAPNAGTGGVSMLIGVQASGTPLGGTLKLKVMLGSQSQVISVPVLVARAAALPVVGGSGYLPAVSASCPNGDVYAAAPVNSAMEQRTLLLRLNAAAGSVQPLDLGLALTEGVTSLLCTPAGELWLTIRSDLAQGSVIAHYHSSTGVVERFPVGASADTINNLTRTPDGRLWFVQYKRDRLGEFDPASGTVTSHAVTDNAENLTLGQDGSLYFSRFYTDPAIVRYDPASGGSTALPIGVTNKNLPRAIVQAQGAVWYVDAWLQQLMRIDPVSGKPSAIALPPGAAPGEMVAAPDGTVWVADAALHLLYRLDPGSLTPVTVPLLGALNDGPRALNVSASGQLWYHSGTQLVGLQ
ncbi:virginiamycin B lyase family protein [Deinococcus sp.]|uniref:Vgb family protein n=1 Tax=Deinococcus sp. TaxID=47478 RepID=UPI003CC616DF